MRTEGDLYVQVNHFIVHRGICPLSESFDNLNPRTAENLAVVYTQRIWTVSSAIEAVFL
jgi:hypothetical protein